MNLCALTMRTHGGSVRDDRPFSGPVKTTYVAPFKGLEGGRNSDRTVTYRSNFFQDDIDDDSEIGFDNNNTFRDGLDTFDGCIAAAQDRKDTKIFVTAGSKIF